MTSINNRSSEYIINEIFLKRWSPRAMSGEPISKKELMTLFEAARWAPSSSNNQPWRFIYSLRNDKYWNTYLSFLAEGNKIWCKNASVLIVVISRDTFEYNNKLSSTHSFDSGAAWENLALQGTFMGLSTHGMAGFDYQKAKKKLDIPNGYTVEMMIAAGIPGRSEDLPEELRERETPSQRKKLNEIIFEGNFNS